MTLRPALDLDALARLRFYARSGRNRLDQSARFYLDDEGARIAVEIPAPRDVAALLSLSGVEAFRRGNALLTRPEGSTEEPAPVDLTEIVEGLHEALRSLPDRPDARDPYKDLRVAASVSSPRFSAWLLDVVRAFREGLPKPPAAKPKPRPTRAPAKSEADRKRESRARRRADEDASSRMWLTESWLDPEDLPAPGAYVVADLHAEAVETLLDWHDSGETLPDGREIAEPGPRVFAAVLKTYLNPASKKTNRGVAYTVTEKNLSTARYLLDRAAAMLLDENREAIEALTASGALPAATVPATPVRLACAPASAR